ncbi:DUF5518 domain-containing protein [Halosimplex halobium]|uniref:DUF5518 domain-containing protein n=1 Tax=Halosimplex halobium TaxID=3396618 RepID=UPI003F560F9E
MSREPSSRFKAAFVGSIASFIFGILPIVGPMSGGLIAGFLRGSDGGESAFAGMLANIIASIPLLGLAVLVGVAQIVEGVPENVFGLALVTIFSCLYFYGFGALGGYIGSAFSNRSSRGL